MGTRARKRRNELVTASYAYVRCHGVIDARQCEGRAILLPLAVFNSSTRGKRQTSRAARLCGETSSPYPYMSHHLHALAA
jgi:hypothetical protein